MTVCDSAHEELAPIRQDLTASAGFVGVAHWSIPDPVPAGTAAAFDDAYADIAGRITDLVPR